MSPSPAPLHCSNAPASRWLAVGSAALVTLLAVGGALGLGPGAAMAQSPSRQAAKDGAPAAQKTDPDGAGSGTTRSGNDWLTVDDPAKRAKPPGDPDQQALPGGSGHGRRVVYDVSAQRVWLVAPDDKVKRTYPVSGSRRDNVLEPGRYHVYSKSRHAVSFNHKETMDYMVRFASGRNAPIGFHDIPVHRDGRLAQSRDDLGTPTSAGCIRQWIDDAQAMWDFADIGTLVVVKA